MSDFLRAMFSGGTIPTDHMPPDLAERFSKIDWNDPQAAVEMMKTRRAVAEVTRHLRTDFPKVAVAMVDERDEMMTNGLLHKCPGRTVAVVGMAHMDGIEARWRAAQGGEGGVMQLSQ
jgi:pheromone shutdown protein TraB